MIFLASPTESPLIGIAGILNESWISSFVIFSILPTVVVVLIESMISSLGFNCSIFEFVSSPRISSNNSYFIFSVSEMSGRLPGFEAMFPESESVLDKVLSNSVSKAKEPPGVASFIECCPLKIEVTFVFIG